MWDLNNYFTYSMDVVYMLKCYIDKRVDNRMNNNSIVLFHTSLRKTFI